MLPAAPLRALLLAVVAALLAAPGASATKKPADPSCKPGQAAVLAAAKKGKKARRKTCKSLAPAAARTTDANLVLARRLVPSAGELRAAAPARLRRRFPTKDLTKLDRAMRRALASAKASRTAGARAVARTAAAPSSCDDPSATSGAPTTATTDGVTVTGTGGRWGRLDDPFGGSVRDITTTLPSGASQREVKRRCVRWDSCPDADGTLAGRFEVSFEHTEHAQSNGVTLDVVASISVEADMVAHVGPDARLTTFDWTASGAGGLHAVLRNQGKVIKYVPDSKVRLTLRGTGADPRSHDKAPTPPDLKAWAGKSSVLDGANAEVMNIAKTLASFAYAVPDDVSDELLNAEKIFYDKAACLDVAFDPATPEVQAGQQVPVTVAVKAKDGRTVDATYTITPTTGSVAERQGRTPGPITYIAPDPITYDGSFQTFELEALSKRGRALGTHSARSRQKVTYWDVTFTGSGTYRRDEGPTQDAEHHVAATFSWTTTWKRVPVGDAHPAPQASATSGLTGAWQDSGRFGASPSGDFTCVGALDDDADLAFAQVTSAGGGHRLQLSPFAVASSAGDDPACTGLPGAPFAGVHLMGDLPALTTTLDVDPSAQQVRRPVHATQPLAADCSDLAPIPTLEPCTHSVEWTGTVTMTKVP